MAAGIVDLTAENFEQEVTRSEIPVMVDFWATWCGPCKMIAPAVEEVGSIYSGRCKVAKLNVDEAMELATRFGVMNIPTLVFFKNGSEVARITGLVSKQKLADKIEEIL